MDNRLVQADAIVFDVGNVLLSFEPEKVIALLPEQHRAPMMEALFGPRHLWSGFDLGRDGNEAVAQHIGEASGIPEGKELALYLLHNFHRTMQRLPLYGMLHELHAMGKRLYALTNYPEPSFTYTCDAHPELIQHLEGVVVSSREKLAKPDPAIFRILIHRFRMDPARTLYIDDTAANTASAAALGFSVWHYVGADRIGQQ